MRERWGWGGGGVSRRGVGGVEGEGFGWFPRVSRPGIGQAGNKPWVGGKWPLSDSGKFSADPITENDSNYGDWPRRTNGNGEQGPGGGG